MAKLRICILVLVALTLGQTVQCEEANSDHVDNIETNDGFDDAAQFFRLLSQNTKNVLQISTEHQAAFNAHVQEVQTRLDTIETQNNNQFDRIEALMNQHTTDVQQLLVVHHDSFQGQIQEVNNRLGTIEAQQNSQFESIMNVTRLIVYTDRMATSRLQNLKSWLENQLGAVADQLSQIVAQTTGVSTSCQATHNLVDLLQRFQFVAGYGGVFLRRGDGSLNFNRNWAQYREGFGDPKGEYWLGLETLHRYTTLRNYKLRVDIIYPPGDAEWAEYSHFVVGGEGTHYMLQVTGFNPASTAADYLTGGSAGEIINEMAFSTYDNDHDLWHNNCARTLRGGWWYNECACKPPTMSYRRTSVVDNPNLAEDNPNLDEGNPNLAKDNPHLAGDKLIDNAFNQKASGGSCNTVGPLRSYTMTLVPAETLIQDDTDES